MKVINNPANQNGQPALSLAEIEAMSQFEASSREGTVLWRPLPKAGGAIAPYCVQSVVGIGRFGIRFLTGPHSVEEGNWYCRDADGKTVPVDDPLEETWQAAMAVRDEVTREFDFGCYIVPVAVFVDMDHDEAIVEAKQLRAVKIIWGMDDLVERVIEQLPQSKWQTGLNASYIAKDVRALTRAPSPRNAAPEPNAAAEPNDAAESPDELQVDLGAGPLTINGVQTVVVHMHIYPDGPGADGENPPRCSR